MLDACLFLDAWAEYAPPPSIIFCDMTFEGPRSKVRRYICPPTLSTLFKERLEPCSPAFLRRNDLLHPRFFGNTQRLVQIAFSFPVLKGSFSSALLLTVRAMVPDSFWANDDLWWNRNPRCPPHAEKKRLCLILVHRITSNVRLCAFLTASTSPMRIHRQSLTMS